MQIRISAILLALVAGSALAQTEPPSLNLQLPQPPDARGEVNLGPATPDDYAENGTSVHGSVTAGVGYSKAYGNSTMNAAELDVSKRYDSGRTVDLHIDVTHVTGLPAVSPRGYYGPRYPAADLERQASPAIHRDEESR